MVRKIVSATVSAALCLSTLMPGIAAAQEYRPTYDAPQGVTATVNLRVPFGGESRNRASYGVTVGYGRDAGAGLDGRTVTRSFNFADIRFTGEQPRLSQARISGFDLANLDRSRQLNMVGGKKSWLWIGLLIAAGVIICVAADCFDGDDDSEPASPGT